MERLTDKRLAIPPGQWRKVTREKARELKEIPVPSMRELYCRLSQIEDILCDDTDEYDLDRLRELAEADREGRCVVLPAQPGDKVYQQNGTSIYELQVKNIVFDCGYIAFDSSAIGTSIYLTREAAEAELKAREQDG